MRQLLGPKFELTLENKMILQPIGLMFGEPANPQNTKIQIFHCKILRHTLNGPSSLHNAPSQSTPKPTNKNQNTETYFLTIH